MTSAPGPMPSAIMATSSASVPDETATACLDLERGHISRSKASTSAPRMKRWLSATRVMRGEDLARAWGAYCACEIEQRNAGGRAGLTTLSCRRHPHGVNARRCAARPTRRDRPSRLSTGGRIGGLELVLKNRLIVSPAYSDRSSDRSCQRAIARDCRRVDDQVQDLFGRPAGRRAARGTGRRRPPPSSPARAARG